MEHIKIVKLKSNNQIENCILDYCSGYDGGTCSLTDGCFTIDLGDCKPTDICNVDHCTGNNIDIPE
ncbi:hypothetical protein [Marinitoga sp. 38H-ov]|uniref:hypothetical protein n=1 Tax=Marinitoga sp. 38H-ov TaxID=1755814 RepID=UPI0013EC42E2|nr:hypothetical protein [Marinitoga sp. 38H-ov]KAF2956184.1 hypothetical protein AS160_06820 [Marinitoga sp. 38H-ov]